MFGNLEVFHSFHYVSFPNISLETQTVFHISKKLLTTMCYTIAVYSQVFFCGQSSHGSPQPAPTVQQHMAFLISRPLGLVQPSSSNFSKQ